MPQTPTRPPAQIGHYLLEKGRINARQLDLAQKHSQEFGVRIGQSLVELGFVREADVLDAMQHQAHMPCIRLTPGIVDPKVAALLGAEASSRLHALAVNRVAEFITVALEDPESFKVVDELADLLGGNVFPVFAEPSVIRKVSAQIFAPGGPVAAATEAPAAWRETGDGAPDEKAVVKRVRSLLEEAFARDVSDIHLETRRDDLRVRLRVHGSLIEHGVMPIAWAQPMIRCLRALAGLGDAETSSRREGTIPFLVRKQRVELRVLTTPSMHGESAVLHVLGAERRRRSVAELGFTAEQRATLDSILSERGGLLLVTGSAASGKITTLHALIEHLVRPDRKVIALEERNEQALQGVLQVEIDPEAGAAGSLRALMNQDPDVLLMGVIDGAETASAVLEAARFGCFVLAGIQAPTAAAAITRFVTLGLEPYLVAETLLGVVAQRLARMICSECKAPAEPDAALLQRIGIEADGTRWLEGKGCDACRHTGARGRVPLFEVVATSSGVWQRIEQGANCEALELARAESGHAGMRDHALALARAGVIGLREVLSATARSRAS